MLPWKPLFALLEAELFPKQRRTAVAPIGECLLDLAEAAQRFFDPDDAEDMLAEFLPRMDGSNLNSVIATQALLVHFLPISHPQRWLPVMFRLWETFTSSLFDDQMLDLLARLAEMHVSDPRFSTPRSRTETGVNADEVEERLLRAASSSSSSSSETSSVNANAGANAESSSSAEQGLWSDVGIFTEQQFALIMAKCLRSAGLPVGANKSANAALMAQSASLRTGADAAASTGTLRMKKPSDRIQSFATIIVYSMARDSIPSPPSSALGSSVAPTPAGTGTGTPVRHAPDELNAAPPAAHQQTFLAGSKALDSLARFIQATEGYFHPSNWGMWQISLSSLVQHLTWEFVKRTKDEEKAECKTPGPWRLTPDIQREFCLLLRTVCLLSMFSKDPITIAASQASLKRMALLEPAMVLPPVLDRAYSSLEALETTHRTSSIITALSTLSYPLVSRDNYAGGGKHLVPLLQLCIPGIDLNDSIKTMATSMFILLSCLTVKIDDLTRPEVMALPAAKRGSNGEKTKQPARRGYDDMGGGGMDVDGDGDGEEEEENDEDEQLRMSTAGFEEWAVSFMRRTLALFEALPEEGKGGRIGGKSEEHVISTLLSACDIVCGALSDHLFDLCFKIVAEHCLSTVSAQGVRVTGSLVACFARANAKKVLDTLLTPCIHNIRAELDAGASSVRTTNTSVPLASDAALHWNMSIVIGALSHAGPALLAHRSELLELMDLVCTRAKSERGFTFASRLVLRCLHALLYIYPAEHRFVNPDEWASEEMQANSHLHWGKLYKSKDVKVQWHVPTDDEIAFGLEILDKIVVPRMALVEDLVSEGRARDKVWSNDFCRYLTLIRYAHGAVAHLVQEPELGGGAPASESDDVPEFLTTPPRFKSGFLLTDESDKRHKFIVDFRRRFGSLLHRAAQTTQDSGAEDQIDSVRLLIRSIRSFMTSYSFDADDYKAHSASIAFIRNVSKLYAKQKAFPRAYWLRTASYAHSSRGRLNSFHRHRSQLDDELIGQVLEFSLSNYRGIRKSAQNSLDVLAQHYDGTRTLCLPKLLDTLRSETKNEDRIKGALYVLGAKGFSNLAIVDARFSADYVLAFLHAQRHPKPSIQKLVRGIMGDFVVRFAEPCTIRNAIESPALLEAARLVEANFTSSPLPRDEALLARVSQKRAERTAQIDHMVQSLRPRVLEVATAPKTHWSFAIYAARLLRVLMRRDEPLDADAARYLTEQLISENQSMRRVAETAVTRVLYHIKLRTVCATEEDLIMSKSTKHPLKHIEALPKPVPKQWIEERLREFKEPKTTTEDKTKLSDKGAQGWLVWGSRETYYTVPPGDEPVFKWDPTSKAALDAVREVLQSDTHWDKLFGHLSQESERDYLSAETINLIKSIFQIYGVGMLSHVRQRVEAYIGERDRHKHRAAAEIVAGAYRGSKHWPASHQDELWAWLDALLPKIFKGCTPDSQPAWQMCVEYMLHNRDPRRAKKLVDYVVTAAKESIGKDSTTQSPFEQAKAQNLLRGVMLSLNSKFTAWAPELVRLYSENFAHDFAEVRTIIGESLADLDLLQVAPCFGSVDELLAASAAANGTLLRGGQDEDSYYSVALSQLAARLAEYRAERIPTSQGTSTYDKVAMTTLLWISITLADFRNGTMAKQAIGFIPTILACAELHDNAELSRVAKAVLVRVATYRFDAAFVPLLVRKLLDVIVHSKDSWRARLDALPILQVVYFQNLFYLDPSLVQDIIEVLFALLRDPHLEVREMAATTLSGIVRCSQRKLIHTLRKRFTDVVQTTRLPKRGADNFNDQLVKLHSGILGSTALLAAFPYEVPAWMPQLIVETVAQHNDSPVPVSTTVKKAAGDFKRTHADTWKEDVRVFSSEQLMEYHEWGGRTDYYA